MPTLTAGTYPAFMKKYIDRVETTTISEAIEKYSVFVTTFFEALPLEKIDYRYADDKWSIKEMLLHIIDTERIFAYRAVCIARHDKTPLPGFDEKSYAAVSNASSRNWQNLLQEFSAVRRSTDLLLLSFTADQLKQSGTTNNNPTTVEALSFVVFGHILHHINIIEERYL